MFSIHFTTFSTTTRPSNVFVTNLDFGSLGLAHFINDKNCRSITSKVNFGDTSLMNITIDVNPQNLNWPIKATILTITSNSQTSGIWYMVDFYRTSKGKYAITGLLISSIHSTVTLQVGWISLILPANLLCFKPKRSGYLPHFKLSNSDIVYDNPPQCVRPFVD